MVMFNSKNASIMTGIIRREFKKIANSDCSIFTKMSSAMDLFHGKCKIKKSRIPVERDDDGRSKNKILKEKDNGVIKSRRLEANESIIEVELIVFDNKNLSIDSMWLIEKMGNRKYKYTLVDDDVEVNVDADGLYISNSYCVLDEAPLFIED